jgi:polyisoprenyl-phosphate glycosyltransferase
MSLCAKKENTEQLCTMFQKFNKVSLIFRFLESIENMEKKLISIVVPLLNEAGNIARLYSALHDVTEQLSRYDFEIILVDDGSTDDSWRAISQLAAQDFRIKGIRFTRNFGTQSATSAGYDYAHGDAIVTLDADLQHPPSLVPTMIHAWEQGCLVVCPRRVAWKESSIKRITAWLHYYFLETYSGFQIPRNVNDFRLIDRQVLLIINAMKEQPRFLRGMLAWIGFKPVFLEYESPERLVGVTGYTWKKLLSLAIDGVVGFTKMPLIASSYFGILLALFSIAIFGCTVFLHKPQLFIPAIFLMISAVQFLMLAIVGEYTARLNDAIRGRPLYVIEQTVRAK